MALRLHISRPAKIKGAAADRVKSGTQLFDLALRLSLLCARESGNLFETARDSRIIAATA
jgi:hypothetical protein